VNIVETLFIWR